jgi:hypothetical protein
MGAPDSPVCQPRHPTVRVLTVLTVGALTDWGIGQSGAAPDSHCSHIQCAFWRCSDSERAVRTVHVHCSLLQTTVGAVAVAPHGTPDSPVNYSGVALQKPEVEQFRVDSPWCTGQSGAPDQGSLRLVLLLSF